MRLSKTTSYAIRILLDCAVAEGQLVKVAEISERQDVTLQNTFKIVHLLSRAGFVQAMRGRNGGVKLARPADAIRIGEVVRAMERLRHEVENDGGEEMPRGLDRLFDDALEAFIAVLDGHTLAEMTKGKAKGLLLEPASEKPAKAQRAPRKAAKTARGSALGAG